MPTKNRQRVRYSPIGVDIGTRSINVIQLAVSSKGIYVHEADIVMLPQEKSQDADMVNALSDIMKRNNFKGKEVVSRMPPSLVTIIPIKISQRENETEEGAILRESKEYIPYPVDEAVIDFLPIGSVGEEGDKAKKILLIFTKRSDVINHLEMLKNVGLKVTAVDIGPNAINRAIKRFKEPQEKHILVINIGDVNSFSTILWDDMILIDRKMGWGENDIIEKLVSNLDIDIDEARKVLYRHGIDWSSAPRVTVDESTWTIPDNDIPSNIYEIIAPALGGLNKEVEKILIYCTSEMKGAMIDSIYLMGRGGFLKHLGMYLQKTLGIGVKSFEPGTIFNRNRPAKEVVRDNFPIFITSIGLALRGCDA